MSEVFDFGVTETISLEKYTESAYLNYSMYVINDRALPQIMDGLKPVQRRIVYAMSELRLGADAKYAKSARTVGDVIGKYHPHGDAASYEAMVMMAQPFSYRYPLVDGQGNWGSQDDPKSFAAMRYTESRLTRYADLLLRELGQGTVDWVVNFDGTLEEPASFPARVPNILLNGSTGIAVGMSTDVPPHNMKEVVTALVKLLDAPRTSLADLCNIVKGPDYPTNAEIITPPEEIREIYEEGRGMIRARAVYRVENGEIVVTALPYQVSGSKVLEQIAQQMQAKKLPMVVDLRDESDHENPTRLVVVPRSNRVDKQGLMAHLFATTDLEKTFRVNLNVIGLDGRPQVKNLKTMLVEWLTYRTQTVTRRLEFRLERIMERLHILEGLLIAYVDLDEVIRIIRTEDDPHGALREKFKLSQQQAQAILDIRLRQLARLEEEKIRGEQADLEAEQKDLTKTLNSRSRLKTLIKRELKEDLADFGDERMSPIVVRDEALAFTEKDLLSSDPITVVLSEKGWIRAAKGHDIDPRELTYRSGDAFRYAVKGRSDQDVYLLDSTGKAYALPSHTLASARGQGEPLTGRLNPVSGATFNGVLIGQPEDRYVVASSHGYGFITALKDMHSRNRSGKSVVSVRGDATVVQPVPVRNMAEEWLAAVTSAGYLLVFDVAQLSVLARGKGIKIISIPKQKLADEKMIAVQTMTSADTLCVHSGKRYLNLSFKDLERYRGERARRGLKLPRGFQKVDRVEVTT